MRDISDWLLDIDLEEYAPLFERQKIDLEILPELGEDDLRELDIPLGHRKKLLKAIADLCPASGAVRDDQDAVAGPEHGEAASDAERRHLTIMFCDLVGSTELSGRIDPEDLRLLMTRYQDACRGAIARFDGFIARYMGDGILVYFGYPRSHEDDAQRAVLAALALLDAIRDLNEEQLLPTRMELAVRTGIATGLVVVGDLIGEDASRENPVIGETPNIAARLQGLAEPNTIVVAQSTRRLLGEAFECRSLGAQRLKGVAAPVRAWQVSGQRVVESRFAAACGPGLTPLVGREEEIALLLKRWQRAEQGEGQIVLVSGEAGIGKSRLTDEIRRSLSQRPHVRVAYQCLEHHQNSAFHPVIAQLERDAGIFPWHEAADRLDRLESHLGPTKEEELALLAELLSIPSGGRLPEIHAEPEQRKQRILSALLDRLRAQAAQSPMLCIVEDVHWIDPSTLELLDKVVEQIVDLPMLAIVTCRPEFSAPWAGQAHTSLMALSRMDRHQSRAFVNRLAVTRDLPDAVVAEIVARTDGIPLFIEELTRALLDSREDEGVPRSPSDGKSVESTSIPVTLQDSLMARLDRLAIGKPVAQVAAALGREFSHELIVAACDRDESEVEEALEELTRAGLVFARGTGSGASFIFKHALVQDIAYQSLLRSARRTLHLRIATTLCERFPEIAENQPESVARHYSEAGEAERAIAYWQIAGERAAARAAHAEAIGHLSRVLDLVGEIGDDRRRGIAECAANLRLAASMRVIDRWDDALEALDRAQSAAERFDLLEEQAEIHFVKGNAYFPLGRLDDCLREHELSRDIARRAGILEAEARALGGMGDAYYLRGGMVTAHRLFSDCVGICREHGFPATEAAFLPMRGIAGQYLMEFREALDDSRTAVSRAREVNNLRAEVVSQQASGYVLREMGRLDEALEASARAIEVSRRLGSESLAASAHAHRAMVLFELGHREDAVSMLRDSYRIAQTTGLRFVGPSILGYLAVATADAGERSWALREGERLLDAGSVSHNFLRFYRLAIDISLTRCDWDEAERHVLALEDYTRPEPLPWADFVIARGRALARFGRGARDPETLETLSELLRKAREHEFSSATKEIEAALMRSEGEEDRIPG